MYEGLWDKVKKDLDEINYGVSGGSSNEPVISDDMVMQEALQPGTVPEVPAAGNDVYGANPIPSVESPSRGGSITVGENPAWFGGGGANPRAALENPFDNFLGHLKNQMEISRLEMPELKGSVNFAEWHGAQKNLSQLAKIASIIAPLTSQGTYGIKMAELAESKRKTDLDMESKAMNAMEKAGIAKDQVNTKVLNMAMSLMPTTETDIERDEAGNIKSSKKSRDMTNIDTYYKIADALVKGDPLTAEQQAKLKGGETGKPAPTPEEFLAKAKLDPANKGYSDEQLLAFHAKKYGGK
jgi:hypothetical protein